MVLQELASRTVGVRTLLLLVEVPPLGATYGPNVAWCKLHARKDRSEYLADDQVGCLAFGIVAAFARAMARRGAGADLPSPWRQMALCR